jgi:hypothetical protein
MRASRRRYGPQSYENRETVGPFRGDAQGRNDT